MSFEISIAQSEHKFSANADQSILDAALDAGILLPYSCKSGSCSTCKGKVVSGDYSHPAVVDAILSPEDVQAGYTLFCQAKAQGNLVIEPREVRLASDIQVRKMPARVASLEQLRPDVMVVKLQLPSSEPFNFYAGQYIEFILKDGSRRSYSMATPPNGTEPVELHLRHMPGGKFTDHVFGAGETKMKEREILRVEGPFGSFFLREDSDAPIVFLASGTGFAPIKAIMESIIAKGIKRKMVLYWGGNRPDDLYMMELAKQWEADLPNFSFIPVVSNGQPEDNWTGRTGYVHHAVLDDIPDLSAYQVYACGAPPMVNGARKDFVEKANLPESEFYADSFVTAADVAKTA